MELANVANCLKKGDEDEIDKDDAIEKNVPDAMTSCSSSKGVPEMLEEPIISSLIQESFLENILRVAENDQSLEITKIEKLRGCKPGDNYMSHVTRILVTGRSRNRKFRKSVLLKRVPDNKARREAFRCDPAFKNEIAAYQTVLPKLTTFSNSELPFPACLYASSQMIVFEDLQPYGFKMGNRLKGLDLQHTKLALKALGQYHGISMAMKHKDPDGFENLKPYIKELIFLPESEKVHGVSLEISLKMAFMCLENYKGPAEGHIVEALHRMRILPTTVFKRMTELVRPKEPMAVICHGDFWINNVLFKYDEKDTPTEIMFVDLQSTRYSSPAIDILHFLCTSMEPGLCNSHHDELIEIYHESLSSTVMSLAPNAPQITLKHIQDEIELHALYGLLMAFLLLQAITATNHVIDLDAVQPDVLFSDEFILRTTETLPEGYFERLKLLMLYYIDQQFI